MPGWALTDPGAGLPLGLHGHPATLTAGDRIAIPTTPARTPGAPSGVLIGKLSGLYSPRPEPIVIFDARARLLARLRVPGQGPFRLRLDPGHYLLLKDNEAWVRCGPARVRVRPGRVVHATVAYACD